MNAATQRTPYGNYRSTAIIESLHEINEIAHIYDIEIFPALARVIVKYNIEYLAAVTNYMVTTISCDYLVVVNKLNYNAAVWFGQV